MKRAVITSIIILVLILIGTAVAVFYARGYRFNPDNPNFLQGTGVLVLTSKPDGARVYINDELRTATNNTINLSPGTYQVRIEEDGYFPWKKTVEVKEEVVSSANALLFPIAPRLESITLTGATNPVLDETKSLIAYTVSSGSATRNGIYTLDMNARAILPLGGGETQIANDTIALLSSSMLTFSPDNTDVLASIPGTLTSSYYLLSARSFNSAAQNITATINTVRETWQEQKELRDKQLINSLPRKIRTVATDLFKSPILSEEEDKILYVASRSATIPILIEPRLPGTNSTPERRNIIEGNQYVYDMKEDRNYLIFDAETEKNPITYQWHPDSAHLIYVKDAKVNIMEYDGGNVTTVYAGPFENGYVFPWPDGSSIVVLTNLNIPGAPTNLYRISLR